MSTYSYARARDTLFAFVDDADRTRITDIYTGRVLPIAPGQDPTSAGCDGDRDGSSSSCSNSRTINTEHLWPQSYGARYGSAKTDLHHLWPARGDVNSARGNKPFGQFAYSAATRLYADTTNYTFAQAGADTLLFSAVSSTHFMPRASVRGDVARALFYFRSIYQNEVDESQDRHDWFDGQLATLIAWHRTDPPDQAERDRSARVKGHQGNDNPFVIDATLADRAYATGALPVELVAFTATLDGKRARLDWTTASETGNSGFHVEHDRDGGFVSISFATGHGTTLEAQHYRFTTAALAPGTHRFRLRQVDLDGSQELSPVVELTIPARALAAYPNPARASVRIDRPEGTAATVYDLLGQHVATLAPSTDRLDVSALSPGLYLIRAASQTRTLTVIR
jgi:endonuclease I